MVRSKEKFDYLPKNMKVTPLIGAIKEHVWNSKTVNLALGFQSDAEANEFMRQNWDAELVAGIRIHEERILAAIEQARSELSEKLRRMRMFGPNTNQFLAYPNPNSNPNPTVETPQAADLPFLLGELEDRTEMSDF